MPYYDTIDEDLERATDILAKGRPKPEDFPYADAADRAAAVAAAGGHIFGVDIFAAYKLLESFVAEIERLRALADAEDPVCRCGTMMVCPDIGCDLNKGPTT